MRFCVRLVLCLLVAFMAGCNGASNPQLLEEGKALLNKGQYDDAIDLLKKATQKMPKSVEAYNYLGLAYQGKGDQTQAVRAFEKSIALDPRFAPALFNLGAMYFERQQHDRAIANLSRFVALQPDNIEGCYQLAEAQFATENLRDAYGNYLKVIEADPNRPQVLNNLGVISAKLGQAREAETWFHACTKTDVRFAPAFLNLAILYHRTSNKPAAALDYYQKFLELEPAGPSSDLARQSLAELNRGGVVARAQEQAPPKTVAQGPKVTDVEPPKTAMTEAPRPVAEPAKPAPPPPADTQTVARVQTASLAGPRWPKQNFPKAAPGKRNDALTQFNRGAQYQKDGLLDAATFCYREALKLDPTLTAAHYNLGTALQSQGMTNQAIEAYLRALSQQPSFSSAHLNLAILFEGQRYLADAAEQYEAILKDAPNDATAHLALGRVYGEQPATHPLARQHYQRYLELAPATPEAKRVQRALQQLK